MNINIARFHNIFGPEGSWNDGREKAPAAFCRKVAMTPDGDEMEMWGDGIQTRSFLYIDECLEGMRRLMDSDDFFIATRLAAAKWRVGQQGHPALNAIPF